MTGVRPTQPTIVDHGSPVQPVLDSMQRFLAQRQQKIQNEMRVRQMEIQEQQLAMQGLSQRALERERKMNRVMQLMDMLGPSVLEDPEVQRLSEEGGFKPQGVLKKWNDRNKAAETQLKQARSILLQNVPAPMQKGMQVFFNALDAGFGQDAATTAMRETFKQNPLDEATLAHLAKEWPHLFGPGAGIPVEDAIAQLVQLRAEQASMYAQFGPGWKRHLDSEIAKMRLYIMQQQLPQLINNVKGNVSPSQRLSAALAYYHFFRRDLDENKVAYGGRFLDTQFPPLEEGGSPRAWYQLSPTEQIAVLYGPEIAQTWAGLPAFFQQLGGFDQYGVDPMDFEDQGSLPTEGTQVPF